ncbi:MAG: filamentous hemagglutinin N-terminal domain-containing protein [Methylacidiphilales bacterium]|nr:filamentous hemagglutinin N-terminal domain-containing protein [Candidatus Methylacidiphilales bacterium]
MRRPLTTLVILILTASSSLAHVIPDGATDTHATLQPDGSILVEIAPVFANGISHNTYTEFNVPSPGLFFDNQTRQASTILNEVTGSNPSFILGNVEVLGARAHVILVNPHGITVNGSQFINTGGLVLSTGQVDFVERNLTPVIKQKNIQLTTDEGTITIGENGLAGAFTSLQLLARKIQVQGPLINENDHPNAHINLIAGSSIVEFDSSVAPTNASKPWSVAAPHNSTPTNEILIDITSPALISASKIQIAVTSDGAGVRHAGSSLASGGDFILTSNGEIKLANAKIEAKRDIIIEKRDTTGTSINFSAEGSTDNPFQIKAGRHIDLLASHIALSHGRIDSEDGDITLGLPNQPASSPSIFSHVEAEAGKGIGLFAIDQPIVVTSSNFKAESGLFQIRGRSLTLDGSEDPSWKPSTFIGAQLDLIIPESLKVSGSKLLSYTDLTIQAGDVAVEPGIVGDPHSRSEISAIDGGLYISTTSGDFINQGSIISGNKRISGLPASQGGVTLHSAGQVLNQSLSASQLAVITSLADDLKIQANGDIINHTARLFSSHNIILLTPTHLHNYISYTPPDSALELHTRKTGWFIFRKKRTSWLWKFNNPAIAGQLAFIVAGKGIQIHADQVTNDGGEITANGGALLIDTRLLKNIAVPTGTARYEKISGWWTHYAKATSNQEIYGGQIQSNGSITISAAESIENVGGRFLALADLTLISPSVIGRSIQNYQLYQRPNGIRQFFGGPFTKLIRSDFGGQFISWNGTVRILSATPVLLDGGEISSAFPYEIPMGVHILRHPSKDRVTADDHLGFFDWLF